MSGRISLESFSQAAQQAARVGGSLDVTQNNELVVRGSTWLGRQVQWLRGHLFPNKVRQQNQKVLDALKQTLSSGSGAGVGELDVSLRADRFTQKVEQIATARREEQIFARRQEEAFVMGSGFFDRAQRGEVLKVSEPESPKVFALARHMGQLEGRDKLEAKMRFVHLLENVVTDREFGIESEIPGGTGTPYIVENDSPRGKLLLAAYLAIAEDSHKKSGGDALPEPQGKVDNLYGLESEKELKWLRLKRNTVG